MPEFMMFAFVLTFSDGELLNMKLKAKLRKGDISGTFFKSKSSVSMLPGEFSMPANCCCAVVY
jgi:hypothetical protein